MLKSKVLRLSVLLLITAVLATTIAVKPASALISQNSANWFTGSDTSVVSVVVADVNGDGVKEIVTGGYFNDGTRWNAQVLVINASTMAMEKSGSWFWGGGTSIASIAVGDVNNDGKNEIVTGGSYFDGTRWNAQVAVLNASATSSALTVLNIGYWFWNSDTSVASVAVGDVNGDGKNEIVTGGSYFDGTRNNAQVAVLNASATSSALTVLNIGYWFWNSDTSELPLLSVMLMVTVRMRLLLGVHILMVPVIMLRLPC